MVKFYNLLAYLEPILNGQYINKKAPEKIEGFYYTYWGEGLI
jgi:hypothetical protein